jgi:hypothetical protein
MNSNRRLLLSAAITLGGFTACNYTVGECYPRDQSSEDPGGGTVITPGSPSGSGDFGAAPPKQPQDATSPPPPDCNIVPDTPCNEKCLTDYVNAAAECGNMEAAQRTTCQDSAYARYKSCRDNCLQQSKSWRKKCEDEAEACEAKCRDLPDKEDRRRCWEACNNDFGKCVKKC